MSWLGILSLDLDPNEERSPVDVAASEVERITRLRNRAEDGSEERNQLTRQLQKAHRHLNDAQRGHKR